MRNAAYCWNFSSIFFLVSYYAWELGREEGILEKNSQRCSDVVSTLIVGRVKRNKHNNEIVKLIIKVILDTDNGYMYKTGKSAWEFALVKRVD